MKELIDLEDVISLANVLKSFSLPQVAGLISNINIEDITIRNNIAYLDSEKYNSSQIYEFYLSCQHIYKKAVCGEFIDDRNYIAIAHIQREDGFEPKLNIHDSYIDREFMRQYFKDKENDFYDFLNTQNVLTLVETKSYDYDNIAVKSLDNRLEAAYSYLGRLGAQLDELSDIEDSLTLTSEIKKLNETIKNLKNENLELNQTISNYTEEFEALRSGIKGSKNNSRNFDSEIVVYLSFILAQKHNKFSKNDGSINASQVGQAINGIAQELGLDQDDMHGFKRPDARIRDLIKEHENLLVKFKELVKK